MKSERLKKLKVRISSFSLKDMLNFKNLPLRRDKAIEAAEDKEIVADFPINNNARALHPDYQKMVVQGIIDRDSLGTKTLVLKKADGTANSHSESTKLIRPMMLQTNDTTAAITKRMSSVLILDSILSSVSA